MERRGEETRVRKRVDLERNDEISVEETMK